MDGQTDRRLLLIIPPSLFRGVLLEAGGQWVGSSTVFPPRNDVTLGGIYKNAPKKLKKKRKEKKKPKRKNNAR